MPKKGRFHYCVLFTQTAKQARLTEVLREALPEERGIVFYPCMEYYRRDTKQTAIKPIFPGYVFVRSDMSVAELHEFIKKHRDKAGTYIRELGLQANMESCGADIAGGADVSNRPVETDRTKKDDNEYELKDLTEDEARFMDFLLGIVCSDSADDDTGENEGNTENVDDDFFEFEEYGDEEPSEKAGYSDGLLRMSYGYQENGKYIVMEGPLKVYEDRIVDVNKHERKAFLDFEVNGYQVRAGLEIKPKTYWFPEDAT